MKTLGILGSDNSHSHSIAKVCNILEKTRLRATHIAGESEDSVRKAAEAGAIPHQVADWRDLAGRVDAVMIDHRHGRDHYEPARYFLGKRMPVFVDKPLTTDLEEARELLDIAARDGVPLCTFGLIPLQASFRRFQRAAEAAGPIRAVNTTGPVDLDSPNGGIFFYGFHQVDVIVQLMGTEAEFAHLWRSGANGMGTIGFSGGRVASFNCLSGEAAFHWRACSGKEAVAAAHRHDTMPYLASARILERFVARGEVPWTRSRMLAPIAILQALEKSLRSGKPEPVEEV